MVTVGRNARYVVGYWPCLSFVVRRASLNSGIRRNTLSSVSILRESTGHQRVDRVSLTDLPPSKQPGGIFMTVISTIAAPNNSDLRPYAERKRDSQVTITFAIDGTISGDWGVGVVLAKQEHDYSMCRQSFGARVSRVCAQAEQTRGHLHVRSNAPRQTNPAAPTDALLAPGRL